MFYNPTQIWKIRQIIVKKLKKDTLKRRQSNISKILKCIRSISELKPNENFIELEINFTRNLNPNPDWNQIDNSTRSGIRKSLRSRFAYYYFETLIFHYPFNHSSIYFEYLKYSNGKSPARNHILNMIELLENIERVHAPYH